MYKLCQDWDNRACCWGFTALEIHSQKSATGRFLIQLSALFALKFFSVDIYIDAFTNVS